MGLKSQTNILLTITYFLFLIVAVISVSVNHNGSSVPSADFPDHHMSFNSVSDDCSQSQAPKQKHESITNPVKLHLRRHRASLMSSTSRDSARIQILHRRVISNKKTIINKQKTNHQNQNLAPQSPSPSPPPPPPQPFIHQQMTATLESGVGFGSGEYFMDVFIGTPPKHFSLILDTGSDLNWIQCKPCLDCFNQSGPIYDPSESSSYKNISCSDSRCNLVTPPDSSRPCVDHHRPCPYYYWYGDSSNTTGDFAIETFTVNETLTASRKVEEVMFGCGHWNRGLFRGAAGLLGLGRGPLSFSSQLQSLYGHSFSYCLVDRDSDSNVTSNLVFGDNRNDNLNFTALVGAETDTFYYVAVKTILVGGEAVQIPEDTWLLSEKEGTGGTIVDSGTTLSYFVEPAYRAIEAAFLNKTGEKYRRAVVSGDFPLEICYNVSGVEDMELPDFSVVFVDGAVWDFPVENYFIRVEPQEVVCLAMKSTVASGMNIIGNYQQQNFHVLYDTKNSRLGFAPANCADEALR